MMKGNSRGELESHTKVQLYLVCKWTSKDEVSESLNCEWTEVTVHVFWSEGLDAVPKGQGIHKQLVVGLPMARKEGATPYAVPDVRRRKSQAQDGTAHPVQSLGNPVQHVQVSSCSGGSDLA